MSDRILVVDDDPQITTFLSKYLEKQGFAVSIAATGQAMRDKLASDEVDLCVLDIGLPDADGLALTREIRETSTLPIIVLTVRDNTLDTIFGLEYGADDYMTKPFEPRELAARIRSVLRRTRQQSLSDAADGQAHGLLRFGHWIMDASRRTLAHADTGEPATLTSTEFDLLATFVKHPRVALSRDQLVDAVRGGETVVGDRAIDVHVMRLRKKIEPDPHNPRYIKTIHGMGYCLADDVVRQK